MMGVMLIRGMRVLVILSVWKPPEVLSDQESVECLIVIDLLLLVLLRHQQTGVALFLSFLVRFCLRFFAEVDKKNE